MWVQSSWLCAWSSAKGWKAQLQPWRSLLVDGTAVLGSLYDSVLTLQTHLLVQIFYLVHELLIASYGSGHYGFEVDLPICSQSQKSHKDRNSDLMRGKKKSFQTSSFSQPPHIIS